jgi:hypothetical protein
MALTSDREIAPNVYSAGRQLNKRRLDWRWYVAVPSGGFKSEVYAENWIVKSEL